MRHLFVMRSSLSYPTSMNYTFSRYIFFIPLLLLLVYSQCSAATTAGQTNAATAVNGTDPIAIVLGKPLQKEQFNLSSPDDLQYDLQELIITPLFKKYYEQHKKEMEPTSLEITDFLLYSRKQHEAKIAAKKQEIIARIEKITSKLQAEEKNTKENYDQDLLAELFYLKTELEPPGYNYAMFIVPFWKIQVYIYNTFGKGRILIQDRGYEAFDAMLNWLLDQEKQGNFTIKDAELHRQLYSYWKDRNHGDKVISDKKIIDKEFLHPPWHE